MNKALIYLRRSLLSVIAVVSAAVLLTACLKDDDYDVPSVPSAGLMSFNLAPDQSALVIRLSGNNLTPSPLAYTNYTGVYQNIYTGNRQIETYDLNHNGRLTNSSYTFEPNKYYSLFVTGADSAYRNIVSADNFDSLPATDGNAYVRYINAVTDTVHVPTVTIAAGGNNVVNENAPYGAVSEFRAITPGEIAISVRNNAGVEASRNISVEQKKVYTILLVGKPGATDDARKVQIKFINNGILSDSTSR